MVQTILYISISVFIFCAFLCLVLIFISRLRYIKRDRIKEMYLPYVDEIISNLLFEEQSVQDVLQSDNYQRHNGKKAFNILLLRSVVKLHTTYAGVYAKKLEEFYYATNLKEMSIEKIRSRSWKTKCKGIREVSEMNLEPSYTLIYKYIDASNSILRLEALTGLIRLKGFDGLKLLRNYTLHINDWIQINMLYALKNSNEASDTDISFLLYSPNESLITFGLRIIEKFGLVQYQEMITQIALSDLNDKNKQQILLTQNKLMFL